MFPFRPKWPILAIAVVLAIYGVKRYRLEGLDQLRLEVRDSETELAQNSGREANQPARFNLPPGSSSLAPPFESYDSGAAFHFGADQLDGQPSSNHHSASGISPPNGHWHGHLSLGEKLALWEHQSQKSALQPVTEFDSLPSTNPSAALPSSGPIPIPPGYLSAERVPNSRLDLPAPPSGKEDSPPMADASAADAGFPSGLGPASQLSAEMDPNKPLENARLNQASGAAESHLPIRRGTIRIATWNTTGLNHQKLEHPEISNILVETLSQYDLIALQDVRSSRDDVLPALIRKLNATGRRFDYLIGPRVGRLAPQSQFALLFDTRTLETDRYQLYTLDDPQDLLNFEPLVAWFRCKQVPAAQAFTFSLVNMQLDANFANAEIRILPQLIRGIQNDGRHEDDWILLGDFAQSLQKTDSLADVADARFVILEEPTTVDGSSSRANLLFSGRATVEFTGRFGVSDFLRSRNLSLEEAQELSHHLPIWADFATHEGFIPGLLVP